MPKKQSTIALFSLRKRVNTVQCNEGVKITEGKEGKWGGGEEGGEDTAVLKTKQFVFLF